MPSLVTRTSLLPADALSDAFRRLPGAPTTKAEREMMRQLFFVIGISRTTIARALDVSYSTVWTYTHDPAQDPRILEGEPTR